MKRNWPFEAFVLVTTLLVIAFSVTLGRAVQYLTEPGTRDEGALALAIAIAAFALVYVIMRLLNKRALKCCMCHLTVGASHPWSPRPNVITPAAPW